MGSRPPIGHESGGMQTRLRQLVGSALFGATACCSWAFAINRTLNHTGDAPLRTLAQLALCVGLSAAAWMVWRRQPRWLLSATAVALGAFVVGEAHRLWLRESYGATVGAVQTVSWLQPVTTTDLAIDRYTVRAAKLGRDRLRVVHLSDLHVTEEIGPDYYARVSSEVKALEPDVIVLTGDYISKLERLDLFQRWLQDFPHAPDGTYAVLGNHDYWTQRPELVRDVLTRAGVKVLSGDCQASAGIRVCGTDVPWGPELAPSTLAAGSDFTLVLSHTPDNIYDVTDAKADAMFAGHTHGGQLRLPTLGALIVPSFYGRRFDRGHFVVGQTNLFVSSGIGADAPALRLWCRPAIVVVDFVGATRKAESG